MGRALRSLRSSPHTAVIESIYLKPKVGGVGRHGTKLGPPI